MDKLARRALKLQFNLIFIASLMSSPQLAWGKQITEQCPLRLGERVLHLEDGPPGWVAYSPTRMALHSAGFMAGMPATKTNLKPYSTENSRIGEVSVWKFEPGSYPEPDGLWLLCAYGDSGDVTLSKKMTARFSECTIVSKKSSSKALQVVVSCL